jgi:hypothetical protein
VSLTNVWVQTLVNGLVRADLITGIEAHQTPQLAGKPAHWLLDITLPTSTGSGTQEGWTATALHRTLIQTSENPGQAPTALARLMSQLDMVDAAGVITTSHDDRATTTATEPDADVEEAITSASAIRFRFEPFIAPPPGRHTGAEYL